MNKLLMSIDLEDWFHVENLRDAVDKSQWDTLELRVEKNTDLLLDILNQNNTKATFFILTWVAERVPSLIKKIASEGHEIASHGYGHDLLYNLSQTELREDLHKSKSILENITGEEVIGYRAPNFSITDQAIDILYDLGYKYDSSLFLSLKHDRYGKLDLEESDEHIIEIKDGFYELLLSCNKVFNKNLPWAGGGYFRLLPYNTFAKGINRILDNEGFYLFYIHPWEFDPGQPRVKGLKLNNKLRHYNNLKSTEIKFKKLIKEFNFGRVRDSIHQLNTGN